MGSIISLVICLVLLLIGLYMSVKWLYKRLELRKRFKTSALIEKHCKGCKHAYLGEDYLHHCPLMTGIRICHPKNMQCYRREG